MKLSELAHCLNGKLSGIEGVFELVSTDTRTINSGELFIALKGPQFNGHNFVATAQEKGAVAILASEPVTTTLPVVYVADTHKALGELAAWRRTQINIPLLAVTGSAGKTTTKTMLASIMAQQGRVLATEGTFNNDIGLPLTLLGLTPQHDYAVIEMGANHFGEIAYLTHIAKPNVAVITNIGPVHLEGFGDLDGVARAKGEIFQGLSTEGVAIINADDKYADFLRTLVPQHRCITFGLSATAQVQGNHVTTHEDGTVSFKIDHYSIHLPTLGEHNVMNALAAAAAALALDVPFTAIKQGLETMQPVAKRLIKKPGLQGALIIDDTYNGTPPGVHAALHVLAKLPGEKVLILGDMRELADEALEQHVKVGHVAKQLGISRLYTYGEFTRFTTEAFGEKAQHFTDKQALIATVRQVLHPQMTVLLKGSKAMKMGEVVEAIIKKQVN